MPEQTPLMKQYLSIKERYRDAIVFFRLGDFYEMFGEDAEKASKILQIALTTRDKSKEEPTPMCGIPYFASESYIAKLIKAGYKVAICEQMEDPKAAKGIVERDIVRVITPGTHEPENPKENSYIISLFPAGVKHGVAAADISTGEFIIYETDENIEDEMYRFEPREILIPRSVKENIHYEEALGSFYISPYEDWYFDYAEAYKTLLKHLKVASLEGFGCDGMNAAISAAGALVAYLEETQKETFLLKKISTLRPDAYMFLDAATQRNLELTHNLKERSVEGTLLWVLDETLTPMGGRFLRSSILKPLIDVSEIKRRQEAVEYLLDDFELLEELRTFLRKIQDPRKAYFQSNFKERECPGSDRNQEFNSTFTGHQEMSGVITESLPSVDLGGNIGILRCEGINQQKYSRTPPIGLRDGGIIKTGHNTDIDELRIFPEKGKGLPCRTGTCRKTEDGHIQPESGL